ncbi:MAG: hypothetical protein KDE51_01840 [Anaerolineales bacterium]|nr:hypothetical protein [Anaerolineales bacterium]
MNEKQTPEKTQQSWFKRFLAAVADKCLAHLCTYELGMSPHEYYLYTHGSPIELEDALMEQQHSCLRRKEMM